MGYRRYLSDIMESTTDLTFALVVLDAIEPRTYGGGYPTIIKPPVTPLTDALLEKALDDAVLAIVRRGNDAFPRDKGRIRAEYASKPHEDTGIGRLLENLCRNKNAVDRGRP